MSNSSVNTGASPSPPFGHGEMGRLIAAYDWSQTPLGSSEGWPASLRTMASTILATRIPMALLWGRELILIYNDAYRVICGGKHPAALGRSTREVWSEVWQINQPIFTAVMERGKTLHFEDKVFPIDRHGCRENAHFSLYYSPVRVEDGSMGGILVVLTETAEHKQAAQALHTSEQQYQLLFAANPNPMFVFDEETLQFLAVNKQAVEHYGWSEGEFLAMTVLDIRPVEDRGSTQCIIHWNTGVQESRIGIFSHTRKDGTVMAMEVCASSIRFAGRPARLCTLLDVTDRQRAESALRTSDKKHRTLFEGSRDGIMIVDPVTRQFLACNPAAVKLFGAKAEEDLLTRGPTDFSPERQPNGRLSSEMARDINTAFLEKGVFFFEWAHRRLNGEDFLVDVLLAQVEWDNRPVIMATVREITERKRAEQALRQSEEQVRLKLDSILSPDVELV